jgi:mono/diheme cytochrome c family protein
MKLSRDVYGAPRGAGRWPGHRLWYRLERRLLCGLASLAAGLGLAGVSPVWAQSASNGAALYTTVLVSGKNSCAASACHGSTPAAGLNRISAGVNAYTLRSSLGSVGQMQFLSGHLSDGQVNDLAAYIAQVRGGTPTYIPTSSAGVLSLSASSVAFGSVTVGASATRSLTLSNSGSAALSLSSLSSSASVFGLSHNCPVSPSSLAAGSSCTLNLSFTPTAAGAKSATLSIVSNASTSPNTLSLSGTGVTTATANLAWSGGVTALSLASTAVGSSSAAQTLTLNNSGSASAQISSVSLGGTDATQFSYTGTCTAGRSLAAGSSCTVLVSFEPSSAGSKSATLTLSASNASNPNSVSLSATATASSSGSATASNVGGGGCSLAEPGAAADPALPALALLAAGVLWWRRRHPLAKPPRAAAAAPDSAQEF